MRAVINKRAEKRCKGLAHLLFRGFRNQGVLLIFTDKRMSNNFDGWDILTYDAAVVLPELCFLRWLVDFFTLVLLDLFVTDSTLSSSTGIWGGSLLSDRPECFFRLVLFSTPSSTPFSVPSEFRCRFLVVRTSASLKLGSSRSEGSMTGCIASDLMRFRGGCRSES